MICLLCNELTDDFISLNSEQGRQKKLSMILYKYFQFCFTLEPTDGDVCLKCWQKTLAFHEFCVKIETIHGAFDRTGLTLSSLTETVKVEIPEADLKFDATSEYDLFHDETDQLSPECSQSEAKYASNETVTERTHGKVKRKDGEAAGGRRTAKTEPRDRSNPMGKERKTVSKKNSTRKTKKAPKRCSKNSTRLSMHTCKIRMCLEEFETMDALILHKTAVHRRIQCTHCPDLKLVVDLNQHLRNSHGIMQNSICEHCGQVYMNTRSLQDHIQRKHEVSEPLQCDICKEWFKSRDTIRAHMNYVHVQGPQTCPECGKVSANRKALRKHQTIHLESWKDRFKCIVCGRGFRDSTKLKEHSYIHTGITDAYLCQFCGQSFRFGSSLSAHRMKYHPNEMAHVKDRLQRKKNLEFKV